MRILIVEDHPELRRMTAEHLTERGFVVDAVGRLSEARDALESAVFDAMVVDIGLPDGEGLKLLTGEARPPAILVTARDRTQDRIFGLNAGADDYLVKPFDLCELEARLRAILRRPGRRAALVMILGRLSLDPATREAFVDEAPLRLRRREALLLEALLEAQPRIVVRDILEERLYGFDEAVTPNALEASVSRLRRSLEAAGADVRLETHRGLGYSLARA
jgi:DNA-binding response OmpR family regulator